MRSRRDPVPRYVRISDDIRAAITSGELSPGDPLPALPALAERYAVSEITARSAVRVLKAEKLVVTRTGVGTFVADSCVQAGEVAGRIELAGNLRGERFGLTGYEIWAWGTRHTLTWTAYTMLRAVGGWRLTGGDVGFSAAPWRITRAEADFTDIDGVPLELAGVYELRPEGQFMDVVRMR